MTPQERYAEEIKAFTAELGRATVKALRKYAEVPSMVTIDGRSALLIVAESLEQGIEEETL